MDDYLKFKLKKKIEETKKQVKYLNSILNKFSKLVT